MEQDQHIKRLIMLLNGNGQWFIHLMVAINRPITYVVMQVTVLIGAKSSYTQVMFIEMDQLSSVYM